MGDGSIFGWLDPARGKAIAHQAAFIGFQLVELTGLRQSRNQDLAFGSLPIQDLQTAKAAQILTANRLLAINYDSLLA
jgi:hypothetical protein